MSPPIRVLDLDGSPASIGAAHGTTFTDDIRRYTEERVGLVTGGLWSGGPIDRADVLELASACLAAHEDYSPGLHTEMLAMADAAGISAAEAVVVGGFTDFVDTVRGEVGGRHPASVFDDDCTAFLVPDGRARGAGFFGQTWDMHDTATEFVTVLRIRPDDAPAALVFTTTGCLGQMGMNEAGLCVGINNLTGADGRIGVTWPTVVRQMLTKETAADALHELLAAPLAGAHNYLVLDADGIGYDVEAMSTAKPVVTLGAEPLVHTNHALDPAAVAVEAERPPDLAANSQRRLELARELLAGGEVDEHRLMALTREPEAICQKAVEPYHIESGGAVIMRPRTGDFWACWGRPAENDYERLSLDAN